MEIKNVTIKTGTKYIDDEEGRYTGSSQDTLNLEIPLPGGTAQYEIILPKGVKDSLEFAAQLVERSK